MERQELIQKTKTVMNKAYCNGVTINPESIAENGKEFRIYLDFQVPKTVRENDIEHVFFMKLRNVSLITLSKKGDIIKKSTPEEFVKETIEKYKELIEKRERFIIKLFADKLIKIQQIHISLTPLRKVLRKFKEQDHVIDNLKRNFDDTEIKYINFLNSFSYLRKDGNKYTLDNEYIKRLEPEIDEVNREKQVEAITSAIFAEHFQYFITELKTSSIVPFIGIITSFCNLLVELQKNIKLNVIEIHDIYKEHYSTRLNEYDIEDKVIDMQNANILTYDEQNKTIQLPKQLFENLLKNFQLHYTQQQLG